VNAHLTIGRQPPREGGRPGCRQHQQRRGNGNGPPGPLIEGDTGHKGLMPGVIGLAAARMASNSLAWLATRTFPGYFGNTRNRAPGGGARRNPARRGFGNWERRMEAMALEGELSTAAPAD
jgi:hypothetical protein